MSSFPPRVHAPIVARALEQDKERFTRMFNGAGDAVFITDDAGRIVDANPAALRLAACSYNGVWGETLEVVLAPMLNGVEVLSETFLPGFVVHSVRDLSEQRRVEDAFRHLQRIEVLGQLAAAVAHDFNNLLSVITNDTFSLIAAHPPGDPDHDKLEEICGVVKRGKELTKQLLTLSRKEQQEQRVIDLNDTIRSFAPILKRLAGRDVTFAIRLERNVPRIYADECQIEQVLMNLVANARDAMPRGGTLRITTSGTAKPEWARLTVADTGAGMSPDVVARACEPFFTTKKDHGTGLGLAIVSGIVAQSRGRMGVESELDRGTTFTIELPAHQA